MKSKGFVTGAVIGSVVGAMCASLLKTKQGKKIQAEILKHLDFDKVVEAIKKTAHKPKIKKLVSKVAKKTTTHKRKRAAYTQVNSKFGR